MSYNGSGTFVVNSTGQPVVTGTVISSTAFNALTADLATGLSTAITKDGQTTTTARIVFAQGVSSTLVTDATSATTGSIITAGGISTQKALWVGTTSRHVGATQFDAAITYGGVTLSNAVTGTGNMVLSASPTFTGTVGSAAITATGLVSAAFDGTLQMQISNITAGATKYVRGQFLSDETSGLQFFQTSATYNTACSSLTDPINMGSSGQIISNRGGGLLFSSQNGSMRFYGTSVTVPLLTLATNGDPTFTVLGGSGSRAVLADANGLLSAPVSNEDWKENFVELVDGLAIALALKPSRFDWRKEYQSRFGTNREIGLGAQTTAKIVPEITGKSGNGDLWIDYQKVGVIAIAAIQELHGRISALEQKIGI